MISIKVVNEDRVKAIDISKEFTTLLRSDLENVLDVEIIGPNPCKISRINNKYRYNILIKVSDNYLEICRDSIGKIRNLMIEKYKNSSFIVSINPVNIN